MILAYTLTMPNAGSWNGKWTGAGGCYCIVRKYKKGDERLANAQKSDYHYYDFEDGWGAGVEIQAVDSATAARLRKTSNGFRGYGWMVDEIEKHGRILSRRERIGQEATA